MWTDSSRKSTDNRPPSLKQGWGIAETQGTTNAPATNKTGALQKPQEKLTLQSTPGLKHRKNRQQKKQRPSLKQGWGIAKTRRETNAPASNEAEPLENS